MRFVPNLKRCELEIWSGCNLACPNCDRSAGQAPSKTGMTVEQVRSFVDSSIELKWGWERVTILGGEATLHPQFWMVIKELERLHEASPETRFKIISNGYGLRVTTMLDMLPWWIAVENTHKTTAPPLFSKVNSAPCDEPGFNAAEFKPGCAITAQCGLGITRHGIYPCGAGASIDRVFGLDIGIASLKNTDMPALEHQLTRLCANCGHHRDYMPDYHQATTGNPLGWTTEQVTSPTWAKAYADYRVKKPQLPDVKL